MRDQPFRFLRSDVERSVNRAVDSYDDAALLQKIVGERLYERLDLVKIEPKIILDVGSATGRMTQQLQKYFKGAKVIGVDLSTKMAQHANKQRKWLAKQRYICADALSLPFADSSVDLVFSNLMLHWIIDPDVFFSEIQRVLSPGGLIMFTTFGPDTLKEMRQSWAKVDKAVHVNRFMDMHDIGDSQTKNGFEGIVMDNEMLTMTYDKLSELHADLQGTGEVNINPGRSRFLTGKSKWRQYLEAYEDYSDSNGQLPASWEVIYGHGWSRENKSQNIDSKAENIGNIRVKTI